MLRWLAAFGARGFVLLLSRGSPSRALVDILRLESFLRVQLDLAAIRAEGGVHPKHRLTGYHDFFIERIGAGARVVDVGCGIGALAADIAKHTGARVTGIDIDEAVLAKARARFAHPQLELVAGDALVCAFERAYDVVVLSNVLEHIDRRSAFLSRLAEETGARRFLIRVPLVERDWPVPLRRELGLPYFSDATHFTEYTVEQFEDELRGAGLRVVELQVRWGEIWAEAVRD